MIYLLGGTGYIGQAYQALLKQRGIPYRNLSRAEIDYTDLQTLINAINEDKPEFLINAAGYTGKPNVDACELDKGNCLFGNAVFPGIVAEACQATNTPWGHVSSGCIFTGSRADGAGFNEEDAPNFTFRQNNCSFYSGTKALGEEVLSKYSDIYIWRVRIPFNNCDHPRNYLKKLMCYENLLQATNSISQLDEFTAASLDCWLKRIPFGTYNVTNPGPITTQEVTELIHKSGLCNKAFKFFKDESEFMTKAAITPRSNCTMSSEKLLRAGISLTPIHEAIEKALHNWAPSKLLKS
ncbi:MAG TPA: dTDP-4-dehydrorhamnose reductase [Opitutae bacterium]|nr:dTDP-4-dehydrorhamnose reductase [Opitutae bacterium]